MVVCYQNFNIVFVSGSDTVDGRDSIINCQDDVWISIKDRLDTRPGKAVTERVSPGNKEVAECAHRTQTPYSDRCRSRTIAIHVTIDEDSFLVLDCVGQMSSYNFNVLHQAKVRELFKLIQDISVGCDSATREYSCHKSGVPLTDEVFNNHWVGVASNEFHEKNNPPLALGICIAVLNRRVTTSSF